MISDPAQFPPDLTTIFDLNGFLRQQGRCTLSGRRLAGLSKGVTGNLQRAVPQPSTLL